MYHTIGQRQGLGIGGLANHAEAPWYVVDKDLDSNVLLVAQGNDHPALFKTSLQLGDIYWVAGESPQLPLRCRPRCATASRTRPALSAHGDGYQVDLTSHSGR